MMKQYIPVYELSLFQRIMLIWAFVLGGLLFAFHLAQHWYDKPYAWTRLNEKTKPYWYTFYVLELFLTVQVTHRHLADGMAGLLAGYEVELLDGLWIGLLGLEVLMVVWAGSVTIMRAIAKPAKTKTQ